MTTNANAKSAIRIDLANAVAAFTGVVTKCPAGRAPRATCRKSCKRRGNRH